MRITSFDFKKIFLLSAFIYLIWMPSVFAIRCPAIVIVNQDISKGYSNVLEFPEIFNCIYADGAADCPALLFNSRGRSIPKGTYKALVCDSGFAAYSNDKSCAPTLHFNLGSNNECP